MGHNNSPDQACADPPGGCPNILQLSFFVLIFHVKCFGEILPQIVRSTGLQSFAILHHCLNGVGVQGAGKFFGFAFTPRNNGNGQIFFGKSFVNIQNTHGFFFGFFKSGMGRVTFLPQKLGCAQEKTGTQFPTQHISPLVDENRQVPIAHYPLFVHTPNNRFGCGANVQRLFQFLPTADGYYGAFRRESFNMFGFLFHEALGNEQRKIGIHMARFFKHAIQILLYHFPDGVAVGTNNHSSFNRRVVRQLCLQNNVCVPA